MKRKINKFIYWIPRTLAILFILFIMMFSLDVFGQGYGFWGTLGALLMHNILSFILIALLVLAWKREWIGTIAFGLFGIWYVLRLVLQGIFGKFEWYMLSWSLIIAGPAFLVALLFWINWKNRKK